MRPFLGTRKLEQAPDKRHFNVFLSVKFAQFMFACTLKNTCLSKPDGGIFLMCAGE